MKPHVRALHPPQPRQLPRRLAPASEPAGDVSDPFAASPPRDRAGTRTGARVQLRRQTQGDGLSRFRP